MGCTGLTCIDVVLGDFEVPGVLNAAVINLVPPVTLQSTASQVSHHGASTLANTQNWLNHVNSCVIMLPQPPLCVCG